MALVALWLVPLPFNKSTLEQPLRIARSAFPCICLSMYPLIFSGFNPRVPVVQDVWAPRRLQRLHLHRPAQGVVLGVGTQQAEGDSPGECITPLGNSEVGTP